MVNLQKIIFLLCLTITFYSCQPKQKGLPVIGFVDAVEDETLDRAKKGFFDALKDSGLTLKQDFEVIYRNAQGDIPMLVQSVDYLINERVDLIAANSTLSTITAVQRTRTIPVCMMVSPSPDLAGLRDKKGKDPVNLFGVYETLEYIDTAATLAKEIRPEGKIIGVIFNQSEPQSVDALKRITSAFEKLGEYKILSRGVANSAECYTAIRSLTKDGIDLFFALPDNTIFASFETILQACNEANVPIITSESGLVVRGAVAGFGADMYDWGYESGMEAARYLKKGKIPVPRKLKKRVKMYNEAQASRFQLNLEPSYIKAN
ncbi:MAG: ABC transporter substrate-binding protein [Flavobacteriales bacterium]